MQLKRKSLVDADAEQHPEHAGATAAEHGLPARPRARRCTWRDPGEGSAAGRAAQHGSPPGAGQTLRTKKGPVFLFYELFMAQL